MTQHHTETLRFERQQSIAMREAIWDNRIPPIRPLYLDVLGAIGLALFLISVFWLAMVM